MNKIKIVTDSSCDLNKDIIEKSEYKSYINYVKANDQTKDILSNFIKIEL